MFLKKYLKDTIMNFDVIYHKRWLRKYEIEKINSKAALWKQVEICDDDLDKIKQIYGTDADTRWHRYYAYFTGKMDPFYLPENIFSTKMEWVLNPYRLCSELEDKALLPLLFGCVPDLQIPRTIICKSYGRYYDGGHSILTEKQAKEKLANFFIENDKAIMKPTRDTSSGRNVKLLLQENYKDLLSWDDDHFVIQEVVINQNDIRALNPSSLNTLRVMTYICDGEFFCAPLLLRVGVGNNVVDNAHAGGIFIGVNDDGTFCKTAFSEYGEKHDFHPSSRIQFEGYSIDGVQRIRDTALICHKRIPQLGMVSWDFTINEKGQPVLIEANLFSQSVWLPQIAHGKSIFGKNTEKMLKLIK